MKKLLAAILATALIIMMLPAAYASFDLDGFLNSTYNNSSDMMPKNITMPEQFSLTYEFDEGGKFVEVTMEKDTNGNYHYKDNEDEYLFIKDGKGYKIAIKTVNGFAYKNNDKYTFDHVKELTRKFWTCATPLDDDFTMGTTTEEGVGNICGRKTNKFKVDLGMGYSLGGMSMSVGETTFYDFDQETGICMASSSTSDVSVMGMNSSDGQAGFECIRFELNNIALPTVD